MRERRRMPPRAARSQTHQGIPASPGSLGITVVVTLCVCTQNTALYLKLSVYTASHLER